MCVCVGGRGGLCVCGCVLSGCSVFSVNVFVCGGGVCVLCVLCVCV